MTVRLNRRELLAKSIAAAPILGSFGFGAIQLGADSRSESAKEVRIRAEKIQSRRPTVARASNGDERYLPNHIACFSKGLPRNAFGEVEPTSYQSLLSALASGKHADFEKIPRGGGRKLNNPQAAFAFHLEGGDPHSFQIALPPSVTSEAAARETSELYWQALCRDVPFSEFANAAVVRAAASELGSTPSEIFRSSNKSFCKGPYVSQFLLKSVRFGTGKFDQRYRTTLPGSDFLNTTTEWSQIQSGVPSWREATYDQNPRYIRSGRDLAEFVHYDFPYQPYLHAALILINSGPESLLNCNQFKSPSNPYRYSTVEEGFVTFGQAEVTDWLGRVTTAALKAAYFQKWIVHRRLRPEAMGGLVHQTKLGLRKYPVRPSLLASGAVAEVFKQTGAYLLPQAYPEGSPLHPSYPAGHAAVAGACSVILKVCFDANMLLPGCVEPSPDGLSLVECPQYAPTVGDEIDKLAFNISMGRNWAGIHFRSDCVAGIRLGEDVAISILQELSGTYSEDFSGFQFKRFDGTIVQITPQGEVKEG